MDTTYWGHSFGVMLFKDAITKENLLKYYVKSETNSLYRQGVEHLKSQGFTIVGIVCDGRRGLIQSFKGVPVQMCQFHQASIIRKYITSFHIQYQCTYIVDAISFINALVRSQ